MRQWVILWVMSLVVVAVAASEWIVRAQVRPPDFSVQTPPQPPNPYVPPTTPRVITGADLGFRLEGTNRDGAPVGTWVIRLNGQWVEPAPSLTARPRRITQ